MTVAKATTLLAGAHWRMLMHKLRHGWRENRLLGLTVSVFLLLYSFSAYYLVARGLEFIAKIPLVGPLLTERMVSVRPWKKRAVEHDS